MRRDTQSSSSLLYCLQFIVDLFLYGYFLLDSASFEWLTRLDKFTIRGVRNRMHSV